MTNDDVDVEPDPVAEPVDPLAPDADAPYGYMLDPGTGERRPKKRPGRQRVAPPLFTASTGTPSLEDLKAAKDQGGPDQDRSPDNPPRRPKGKRARVRDRGVKPPPPPAPPFRAGPIATGMNKLYAKIGKLVRVLDYDIGSAILASTRKESEDDTTVGEAWEEIAKVNPRIRRFLLRAIEGGAWSGLMMAHAPILLAVLMKDAVRKHIPFMKLISALLEDDDDGTPSDVSDALGGLQGVDVEEMMGQAMRMAAQMAAGAAAPPRSAGSTPRVPEDQVPVITTLPESA